jgi:hypothetical protein
MRAEMGDGNEESYGFSMVLKAPTWIQNETARSWALAMPATSETTTSETKCRIAELIQYSCEIDQDGSGNSRLHCWPVPRVFRMYVFHVIRNELQVHNSCTAFRCPGRPAIEITRFVETNATTGQSQLPSDSRCA